MCKYVLSPNYKTILDNKHKLKNLSFPPSVANVHNEKKGWRGV